MTMGKHRTTDTCKDCGKEYPLETFRYATSRSFSEYCPDCRYGMKRKCKRCQERKHYSQFSTNTKGYRSFICLDCYGANPEHNAMHSLYAIRQLLDDAGVGCADEPLEQRVVQALTRERVAVKVAVVLMRERYEGKHPHNKRQKPMLEDKEME